MGRVGRVFAMHAPFPASEQVCASATCGNPPKPANPNIRFAEGFSGFWRVLDYRPTRQNPLRLLRWPREPYLGEGKEMVKFWRKCISFSHALSEWI